jgi:hypothetical protein
MPGPRTCERTAGTWKACEEYLGDLIYRIFWNRQTDNGGIDSDWHNSNRKCTARVLYGREKRGLSNVLNLLMRAEKTNEGLSDLEG